MGLLGRLGLAPVPRAVVLDETSLELVAELDVGGWRGDVAAAADGVWFTTWDDRAASLVDPLLRTEARRVELPERPLHLAVDAHGPVVLCERRTLVRVDPAGAVAARVELPEGATGLVAGPDAVWILRAAGSSVPFEVSLLMIDPTSLGMRREVPLGRSRFTDVRLADGTVAAMVEDPPGELRDVVLDAGSGERLPDDRAPRAKGIAERDGVRWLRDGDRGFKRVEIAGGRVLAAGRAPGPLVASAVLAHGCLWACNFRRPRTGEPQHLR